MAGAGGIFRIWMGRRGPDVLNLDGARAGPFEPGSMGRGPGLSDLDRWGAGEQVLLGGDAPEAIVGFDNVGQP